MAKKISFSDEARQSILKGVEQLADAVQATLGPRGRNVLIEKKFGSVSVSIRHKVEQANADSLLQWADNILTAESVEEIFN